MRLQRPRIFAPRARETARARPRGLSAAYPTPPRLRPRSPFFDGAFSPLTGFHEGDASRLGSLSALRRADRIDAEAGRGAPLLPRMPGVGDADEGGPLRKGASAAPRTPERRPSPRPGDGAAASRAAPDSGIDALGRRSPDAARGYAESCGSADSSPGEPAPRRWISVKITPSSVELRRAIARVNRAMGGGRGGGPDSDSDGDAPPRGLPRGGRAAAPRCGTPERRPLDDSKLLSLQDAAAVHDYPASPPLGTDDVGISLLGRLGSPRRLLSASSPLALLDSPRGAQDDLLLLLDHPGSEPAPTNVQFKVTSRRRPPFSDGSAAPRRPPAAARKPPAPKSRSKPKKDGAAPRSRKPTKRPKADEPAASAPPADDDRSSASSLSGEPPAKRSRTSKTSQGLRGAAAPPARGGRRGGAATPTAEVDDDDGGDRPTAAKASATKRFKPCNCRNSRCLKLYCDCFAAGRFCEESCKCVDCHNDQAHARDRDDAIKATLEKNPKAFRAKVNAKAKTHQNGCHCKKSKCLKKYCECFEAGITCGAKCKCADCENYPGSLQLAARRDKLRSAATRSASRLPSAAGAAAKPKAGGPRPKSPGAMTTRGSSAASSGSCATLPSGDEADGPDDSTASAAFLDLLRSAATEASKDDDAAALPALKRPRADDDAALESPRDKVVLVTPVDGAPNPQQLFVEAA